MTKFFVGQRVRIVRAPALPAFVGTETRITGLAFGEYEYRGYEWLVRIEGDTYGACSHNLEPILPSGHAPAEMDVHELLPFLKEGVAA